MIVNAATGSVDQLHVSVGSKGDEFLIVISAGCMASIWSLESYEYISTVQLFRPRPGAGLLASMATAVRALCIRCPRTLAQMNQQD